MSADIKGFNDTDMKVNAGESAQVKVYADGGTITGYIAGIGGQIEIVGSPDILNAVLDGGGRLTARELDADEVMIDGNVFSRVYLGGTANTLKAELENSSRLEAFGLSASTTEVKASGHARAEISVFGPLTALAENQARITYTGKPVMIEEKAYDNSRIENLEAIRPDESY